MRGGGGKGHDGPNRRLSQRRKVSHDLLHRCPFGQTGENSAYRDPCPFDDWLAAADGRIAQDESVVIAYGSPLDGTERG